MESWDISTHRGNGRVTIVLGGGWKLGGAFHAGVLLALKERWQLDARQADSVIGTSSGAIIGGLLGAGMSPDDLYRRETTGELSGEGQAILARLDCPEAAASVADYEHESGSRRSRTLGLSPRGVATAMLPRGTQSMARVANYFDMLVGPMWPSHVDLQFCVVELGSGRRVALDRSSGATVGQAIAASCAIPGVSRPVPIRDREYVDGAIYSVNNADLATPCPVVGGSPEAEDAAPFHTVIVSAPLSVNRIHASFGPMWLFRNAMHLQTAAEVRKLGNVDQLVVIEPSSADVAAMGPDMNAGRRRARVAQSAHETASARFAALTDY